MTKTHIHDPIFDNVHINGTLTRGFNFWGNSGGLFSNIQISNITGSTLAAATCVWIMDAIPYFENLNLSRCDNGVWVRQYDDSIQTNAVIRNSVIEDSRFYGVIVDKADRSNYSNYVMATFEGLEISGTGGENSNGFEFSEGIAAIEVNVSGAIFEDLNVTLHPTGKPFLILKFEISDLDFVITGFWPVISSSSLIALSSFLLFVLASPRPIFKEIDSNLGTCIELT